MTFARGSLLFLLLLMASTGANGQEEPAQRDDERIEFDFSFDYDPAELREAIVERVRWKRIWGPVGVAGYHLFPSQETGENAGPPREIWTNGWGTSLWRDPVTGWPLQ